MISDLLKRTLVFDLILTYGFIDGKHDDYWEGNRALVILLGIRGGLTRFKYNEHEIHPP